MRRNLSTGGAPDLAVNFAEAIAVERAAVEPETLDAFVEVLSEHVVEHLVAVMDSTAAADAVRSDV
jgi:protein-disulfide isomerase-like protein with CxxC motif